MGLVSFIKSLFKRRHNRRVHPVTETLISWEGCETAKYHWWPMKDQGDYYKRLNNNLFATGGCLDKYDQLVCMKAVEYQKKNYHRSINSSESDANWAGFCDAAATLSCTRRYPIHNVKVHYNSKEQVFTPKDIEGLMIVASHNTVSQGRSIFYGERYNGNDYDDIKEPYPKDLVNILYNVCVDQTPFVIDVCKKDAVWNYAYNRVLVKKTALPPKEFSYKISKMSETKKRMYYNFVIESAAYPDKNINIWGWHCGKTDEGGWLSDKHPDFVWKKYAISGPWKGVCNINPDVSAEHVYEIYMASISGISEINI